MEKDSPLQRIFRPFDGTTGESNDQLGNPWIPVTAVLLLLAIPLLPFFVIVWSISRTLRGVRKRVSWE